MSIIDTRACSTAEFEAFVFGHPVPAGDAGDGWYHDVEVTFDAAKHAAHFTAIFENAAQLATSYSPAQIEQGCWAMFSGGFVGNLNDLIWEAGLPVETRTSLIASMYLIYRDLFAQLETETAAFMWWDDLAYAIHPMKITDPEGNAVHRRIQAAMFETLLKILALDSSDCQRAALHGLHHVRHPDRQRAIEAFLARNPDLPAEMVAFARRCAEGRMI